LIRVLTFLALALRGPGDWDLIPRNKGRNPDMAIFPREALEQDKPACIDADGGETLRFRDLDSRANQGARLLRSLGLRPGDVLTHAFRPFPNSPVTMQGKVKRAVIEARERGVLFDIGHGKGSFAFKTARAMLANGFLPDTISSDVHALCINGPAFDQVTTMSKFLCLGVPLADVIAATTVNAAFALKRPELGSLKPGSVGDATILSINDGRFDYVDVVGEHLTGDRKIACEGVVIAGRWWHPKP